jgi:hypothetical protein
LSRILPRPAWSTMLVSPRPCSAGIANFSIGSGRPTLAAASVEIDYRPANSAS